MNKVSFLKWADKYLGRLALKLVRIPSQNEMVRPEKILLIRPGGIGDAVLLIPAIMELKGFFPNASIDVLAENRNGGVFCLCPQVARVFRYDRLKEFWAVVRGSYDIVIDTEQWHRLSAVVARLISPKVSLGFDTNERRLAFTFPVPYDQGDYEVESFMRLCEALGVSRAEKAKGAFLEIPPAASMKAQGLLEKYDKGPLVALYPGASIAERRWGVDKFRILAEGLQIRGIRVVVVGGEQDRATSEAIVRDLESGVSLAGETSLAETAALLAKSDVLVSGDSGVLHIGVGLGLPTVSLFGPGIAPKWAPVGSDHIVINKKLPCSPCTMFGYTPPCRAKAKCIDDISVDEVLSAVNRQLVRLALAN